jgi:multidrug resistance efflux pump
MNVRSPKNGFVIKLFVTEKKSVKLGSPLLQMDSDAEDRYSDHLDVLEGMRVIRAAQYTGAELDLTRSLAKISVETSEISLKDATQEYLWWEGMLRKGLAGAIDPVRFENEMAQSKWKNERAKGQQQRLEFLVARHNQLNELAAKWYERQKEFVAVRKGHLKIAAPANGKVKLLVEEGSFAKYGNIIAEVG